MTTDLLHEYKQIEKKAKFISIVGYVVFILGFFASFYVTSQIITFFHFTGPDAFAVSLFIWFCLLVCFSSMSLCLFYYSWSLLVYPLWGEDVPSWNDIKTSAKNKGLYVCNYVSNPYEKGSIFSDPYEEVSIFKDKEKIVEFKTYSDANARAIAFDFIKNFQDIPSSKNNEILLDVEKQLQETKIKESPHPPERLILSQWMNKETRYSCLAKAEIEENFVLIKYGILSEQKDGREAFKRYDYNDFIRMLSSDERCSLEQWEDEWEEWCVANWRKFCNFLPS